MKLFEVRIEYRREGEVNRRMTILAINADTEGGARTRAEAYAAQTVDMETYRPSAVYVKRINSDMLVIKRGG
jgi:hypothetical protein